MHVLVRDKNVQVRLDGMLVVDYTEPRRGDTARHGKGALSGPRHVSRCNATIQARLARFRSVRVRPLATMRRRRVQWRRWWTRRSAS